MTSSTKRRLFCDLETYSSVDITKAGAFKYVESDDFEIMLLAYAWDDEPVRMLDLLDPNGHDEMPDIMSGILDPNTVKVAHNSAFERACLRKYTGRYLPPEEWEDTMILAAMNGLPLSLDAAGAALELRDQKIKEGTALISYFCKPCRPTIANGGRTRNLPEHAPDKWERFKTYCKRDVEVEQAIYRRLRSFPVTDFERKVWALDARINERGVLIDTKFVAAAIDMDSTCRERHMTEMQRLTGLENPNSVAQLKDWLEAAGMSADSLNKATVLEMKDKATDPTTRRVLELRQQLGKTSVTKYEAMQSAVCADGRVRGLLQYYGAGRTGRWAGRLVQVQNLPQNHLDQIGTVRELVRERDLETLELCFDSVPDVLSQLIRTAFVAKAGHVFHVADYSAIEARVIAYLAGEKWRMDVFRNGGDIYCSSASAMFRVPVVKHGVNGHLRQKGKIAELACIAEGQLVLTDAGLVPIENVTTGMKVWDGIEWVSHGGVICRGMRDTVFADGVELTADHKILTEKGMKESVAAAGLVWADIRIPESFVPWAGSNLPEREKTCLLGVPMRLRKNRNRGDRTSNKEAEANKILWMPLPFSRCCRTPNTRDDRHKGVQRLEQHDTAMPQSERQQLPAVRRTGSHCVRSLASELREFLDRYGFYLPGGASNRPYKQRCGLLPGKLSVVHPRGELPKQAQHDPGGGERRASAACGAGRKERNKVRDAMVPPTKGDIITIKEGRSAVPVYDLLNAGPRHRFCVWDTTEKKLRCLSNCGYGGGVGALRAFGADKMGLTEEEMQDIVTQWRAASPAIPRFWRDAESAAVRAINNPGRTTTVPCGVKYRRDGDALRCRLPSGRILSYWDAKLDTDGSICFMGQNQTTRKWEKTGTWGGKLVENIVQAYARDCLAVAMVRLAEEGWKICFHVHDEVIVEAPIGTSWEQVAEIMGRSIDWAPGLLLRGDGYSTPFYRKD